MFNSTDLKSQLNIIFKSNMGIPPVEKSNDPVYEMSFEISLYFRKKWKNGECHKRSYVAYTNYEWNHHKFIHEAQI